MKVQMLGSRISSLDPTKGLRSIGELKARGSQRPRGDTWMAIRARIFRRDNHTCRKCGVIRPPSELECDHIIPIFQFEGPGVHADDQLQTLCKPCHREKTSKELSSVNSANALMRMR